MDGTRGIGEPSRRTFLGAVAALGLGVLAGPGRAPRVVAARLVAGRGDGKSGTLGYNGASPGPTISVRPGDELRIHLVNSLDRPTNLHTHGLQVSPVGRSDNPFLEVAPGKDVHYVIRVPRDQPPGTYWYHPHSHGHVADQVGGGLLGALLVRGPGEPDGLDLTERLLVVSETDIDTAGKAVDPANVNRMMGRRSGALRVNGVLAPVLHTQVGVAQRWRVVNGCPSRVLQLGLAGCDVSLIAVDGSDLPAPLQGSITIPPGGRGDLLVTPRAEGRFRLLTAQDVDLRDGPLDGFLGDEPPPLVLATVAVGRAGATRNARFTPGPLAVPPLPVIAQRKLRLDMRMADGGMEFAIDGRPFDHHRVDISARRGTVEEWTVDNPSGMPHPFHLHGHPFTVTESGDGGQPVGVPQDVVLIPGGSWVRFWVEFRNPGRTVYHCHVLDHEDAGMMGVLAVS